MGRIIQTQELDYALQGDDIAEGLNAASYMAEVLQVEGNTIRPCIAVLFRDGCCQGEKNPGREPAGHLIAIELCQLGIPEDKARKILHGWDSRNIPELGYGQIERTLCKTYGGYKSYFYSCSSELLIHRCVGEDNCSWRKAHGGKFINRSISAAFRANGWLWILPTHLNFLYLVTIPLLEGRRKVGGGGIIYAGHREIAEVSGLRRCSKIGKYLEELRKFNLIEYQPGDPKQKERKASEIMRVIPVPKVPTYLRRKIPSRYFGCSPE